MAAHDQASSTESQAPARAGPDPSAEVAPWSPTTLPAALHGDAASLIGLQRRAGNRAATAVLGSGAAVQRRRGDGFGTAMADQLARRLREAMAGWGTDEEAIYGALSGRTRTQVEAIRVSYRRQFDRDLQADLHDELTAAELRRLAVFSPGGETGEDAEGTATESAASATGRAEQAAHQLRNAMAGLGTDEEAVFAALSGRTPAERRRVQTEYAVLTGRTLEHDLRDELSGDELREALRLLGQGALAPEDEVYLAISGAGTDEARVFRTLEGLGGDRAAMTAMREAYRRKYGGEIVAALRDDLTTGEYLRAARLIRPLVRDHDRASCEAVLHSGQDTDVLHDVLHFDVVSTSDRLALVRRIHRNRWVGPNDEAALQRIWHSSGMDREAALHQDLYAHSRDRGAEIPEERTTFGTFRNEIEQEMFEGGTTVVRGRFEWTLVDGQLTVEVPVNFEPEEGVTVPLATWNSQIDSVWNNFAVAEPGGTSIPIEMSLRVESSDPRTIRVVQNSTPGSYGPPDRANAGKWYPVMPNSTAPHEFGHLIGLADEYQRTHADFTGITGETRTGPGNTSGRTPAEIAADLHAALHLDDESQRAPTATTLLAGVGLIVAGTPQQGDFAQQVMRAYDDEYSGLFGDTLQEDLQDQLPEGQRWTLQTVFSYASGTVMGNPTVVGTRPHEHPVMPRHLREFANIVRRRFPEQEWTIGPR